MDIRPQPGPQTAFFASAADIVIYGGQAGGGKTWALLLEPLRHIHNPHFGAVIFRRTSPQITNEGGMWDEAGKVYPLIGGTPRVGDLQYQFPSGANVTFRHLQHESNIYDWQGSQVPLIEFDELTHFTEKQFFYLLSRNRSMCGVRPYVRATCNPDADSWVAAFIAWWINQETGLPIPERAGKVRWFVRVNEILVWADSAAELIARFPASADRPEAQLLPKSVTFIPASIYDNKKLLETNPEYLANLMAQPLVERERLLGGNWKVRNAAGKVFNRAWFEIVAAIPAGGTECRFWDFAATEKKLKGDDPDFTAGVKIRAKDGVYYVTDCIAVQAGPAEVDKIFLATARQDAAAAQATGTQYRVRWEIEPGSAGLRENLRLIRLLAPLIVGGVKPAGDKITRAKGLAAQAEAGNVKLLAGPWNEAWLAHMHHQPDIAHDDIMDGSSGSFLDLTAGRPYTTAATPPNPVVARLSQGYRNDANRTR